MEKRLLNTHEDYTNWYKEMHEKFSPEIECRGDSIPTSYPCVVSWYEWYGGFWDNDTMEYHFIYLSDFEK